VPQFVTDDGVRIVYQMWNRSTVLPPLVLHHGFTGGATCDWVESGVVAALTAANRTVIAPDARGHGGSDKPHQPSAYGEARMACDLIQLIDTLAFPQIDLLGFSMGAVVALLAATTDQRIRRLAIVGVGAGVVELGGVDRRALPPDALAAALVADDPTAIENPAAAAFRTNAEARGADLVALAAHAQAIHATAIPLHRITAPTLVLAGDADPFAERPEILASAIPGAQLKILAGDHGTAITNPQFAARVIDFMGDGSPAT
jgi:pimeloyl-ACP methyl ester carboxylesterase